MPNIKKNSPAKKIYELKMFHYQTLYNDTKTKLRHKQTKKTQSNSVIHVIYLKHTTINSFPMKLINFSAFKFLTLKLTSSWC